MSTARRPSSRFHVAAASSGSLALATLLLAAACDRGAPQPVKPRPPVRPATAASPPADQTPARYPAADRIVAIGDLHGDLAATRGAFRLAGAIDAEDDWIGGSLVVVQTGDQIDRGNEDRRVLDFLARLEARARDAGGALHVLDGNHEIMNVMADFRYVTPAGFREFRDVDASIRGVLRFRPSARGRAAAFLPGGPYAKQLGRRNVAIVVGDTVFVHGGLLPKHVKFGLRRLNAGVRAWMNGRAPAPPALMTAEDGPVWTRLYGERSPTRAECDTLGEALALVHAARMVVGHTVQHDGITSGCDERIWRIDVGLSSTYGGRTAVLEISRSKGKVEVEVLRAPAD